MKPGFTHLQPASFGERRFVAGLVRARRPWTAFLLIAVAVMFMVFYLVKGPGHFRYLLLCALHAYLAFMLYVRHCGYLLLQRCLGETPGGDPDPSEDSDQTDG